MQGGATASEMLLILIEYLRFSLNLKKDWCVDYVLTGTWIELNLIREQQNTLYNSGGSI